MPHWRTLMKSEHFCAADLWDERADKYVSAAVKIVKVAGGEVVGKKGRKKEMPFLWLEDRHGKPLRAGFGANKTNCDTITAVLGTADYRKWVGQWIGLYVTKVDGPDGMVDGIRINPKPVPDEYKTPGQKSAQQPDRAGETTGSQGGSGQMTAEEMREALERERKEHGGG